MEVITKDNPSTWEAVFERDPSVQSIDSYREQETVVKNINQCLKKYAEGNMRYSKSLIINGPPGCGKTFVMTVASLLAAAKGLTVTPTALRAERA